MKIFAYFCRIKVYYHKTKEIWNRQPHVKCILSRSDASDLQQIIRKYLEWGRWISNAFNWSSFM